MHGWQPQPHSAPTCVLVYRSGLPGSPRHAGHPRRQGRNQVLRQAALLQADCLWLPCGVLRVHLEMLRLGKLHQGSVLSAGSVGMLLVLWSRQGGGRHPSWRQEPARDAEPAWEGASPWREVTCAGDDAARLILRDVSLLPAAALQDVSPASLILRCCMCAHRHTQQLQAKDDALLCYASCL